MPARPLLEVSQRELLDALLGDTSVRPTALPFSGSLPYAALGGYGLERLCYRILVADGLTPRFFGKVGQPQYGIDLLARDGESYSVYQCKNVQHLESKDIRPILEVFEREWLSRPHLPRPRSFVLICPLDFRDVRQSTDWLSAERDFTARTGILLHLWDRNILDERLRTLPGIVADLFSHRIAEHFCNIDDWHYDLFGDLTSGATSPILSRYRHLRESGHLVVAEDLQELFNGALDAIGAVLLRGSGGSGKSVTGLALAEGLESPHRIYHTDLRYDCSQQEILQGIRRRSSQPCVFILDNCEQKSDLALRVNERIRQWQVAPELIPKLICAYRCNAPGGDHVTTELEDHFAGLGAILDIKPTHEFIRSVLELRKPQFVGLSAARMDRLASLTAGDLVILDWLVTEIDEPADLDALELSDVVERVSKRYPRMRPTVARCVHRVAALQQFDIAPEALTFPCAQSTTSATALSG